MKDTFDSISSIRQKYGDKFEIVPCFEVEQHNTKLYVAAMNSAAINSQKQVDVDDGTEDGGYQRPADPTRGRKVADYYERPSAIVPTSILLNVRGKARFVVVDPEVSYGALLIPKGALLWLVDGQHRMLGFSFSEVQFALPVVLMNIDDRDKEAEIFNTINTEQKGVSTSLTWRNKARRHAFLSGEGWKQRAYELMAKLDSKSDSFWQDKINLTGAKGMKRTINSNTFNTSLKPLLTGGNVFSSFSLDDQVELLNRFWIAAAEIFPDAVEQPRGSLLLKSLGVYAMHEVAAHVFNVISASDRDFSLPNLHTHLDSLKDVSWSSGEGGTFSAFGGQKGVRAAAEILISALPSPSEGRLV